MGYAHQIKIHALAKLGELLDVMPKAGGTRGQLAGRTSSGDTKMVPPERGLATYAELGIDKKTAAVADQLAALPGSVSVCPTKVTDVTGPVTRRTKTD